MSHGDSVVTIVARAYTRRRQAAGVLQAVGLAVLDRAALLHPPVVPDGDDLAVDDEGGADRDAPFGAASAGLGDGQLAGDRSRCSSTCIAHTRR